MAALGIGAAALVQCGGRNDPPEEGPVDTTPLQYCYGFCGGDYESPIPLQVGMQTELLVYGLNPDRGYNGSSLDPDVISARLEGAQRQGFRLSDDYCLVPGCTNQPRFVVEALSEGDARLQIRTTGGALRSELTLRASYDYEMELSVGTRAFEESPSEVIDGIETWRLRVGERRFVGGTLHDVSGALLEHGPLEWRTTDPTVLDLRTDLFLEVVGVRVGGVELQAASPHRSYSFRFVVDGPAVIGQVGAGGMAGAAGAGGAAGDAGSVGTVGQGGVAGAGGGAGGGAGAGAAGAAGGSRQ